MDAAYRFLLALGLLAMTSGGGAAVAQEPGGSGRGGSLPLDAPTTQLDPIPPAAQPPADSEDVRPEDRVIAHEAVVPAQSASILAKRHVRKEPPAPVAERPGASRPDRNAQWVPGYWDWDQTQNDFVWVGGTWRIPPAGSMWVAGRWMRDADGWYRVPGVWSQRRDSGARPASTTTVSGKAPAWRQSGPPADHPADVPGAAPGPDYFYIAGQYVPDGEHVTWKPGFWSQVQPGWDWVPARWVRRSDGWDFRPGSWVRETSGLAQNGDPNVRSTIRPRPGDVPSAVDQPGQELVPQGNPEGSSPIARGDAEIGAVPAPEGDIPGTSALPQSQTAVPPGSVVVRESPPFLYGRVTGLPYVVVRPPGYYPYGRAGVVLPAVVPPFVRDILDRVLP